MLISNIGGVTLSVRLILLFLLILSLLAQSIVLASATYIVNGSVPHPEQAQKGEDMKLVQTAGGITTFTDFPLGYQISYPSHMKADVSLSAIRSVFTDEHTKIEVYYDNLTRSNARVADFIHYGRKFLANTKDHTILLNKTLWHNGHKIHLLKWSRRPLSRLQIDRRYYATAEVIKNDHEVYTIFIKSTEPFDEMPIINSFRIIDPKGRGGIYLPLSQSKTPLNQETKAFLNTYFSETSLLSWGIFQPEAPDVMHHLTTIEKKLGYQFPFLIRYQPLGDDVPLCALTNAYEHGKFVELTLQTFYYYDRDNSGIMYDILDGVYDKYLRQYAKDLHKFSHPVLFRLNNEMNGDWCWYSSFHTAKDTDIYKSVWHYIHDIFVQEGVDNVLWVWNPHDRSFPDFAWNHYLVYYPGDDVVDIVGITGYNTGDYFPGETWREFRDIFKPLYHEYTTLFNKPFMITEFGANSFGGDKAAWINSMFTEIKQLDKIKVAIWWSGIDWDKEGRPGRIYRLDENDAVINAFSEGLKPYTADRSR